jgi:hypothetical protein
VKAFADPPLFGHDDKAALRAMIRLPENRERLQARRKFGLCGVDER